MNNILGEVCMKKRLSFLLSIIIVLSVCAPITSVMAEEARKQSVLKTGKEIAALCSEYDNYNNAKDGDKIKNRLMVKTNDSIDKYGAIDYVKGIGYYFLQYETKEKADFAKKKYKALNYTVNNDSVVKLCDTKLTTPPQYSKWPEEWAYEETDATATIDYYKSRIKPTINIAVIDSGVNYNHELLKYRVVRTKVDFSTENRGDEMDTLGHGTNVAGTIAKSTPSNVKIYAYKFYNKNGYGTSSQICSVVEYIKQSNKKPDIINCSFSDPMNTGIYDLTNEGVTAVMAAGNDNKEITNQDFYKKLITVGATNYYGEPCSFSNYGACVDISAPGEYVYTADMSSNTTYECVNGTSFSTPITAAACAYVLMEHSKFTTLDYYILKDGESEFVVDDRTYWCGIKAYLGNDTNITIPDKINGIEVASINERCFKDSNIESVTLPSSVTSIEQQAFYGCDNLKSINLSNVKFVGTEAFTNCPSLTDNIDLSSVEMISERGLAGTYFKTMNLPKCTDIRDSAFEDCTMHKIVLNSAKNLGSNVFKNCKNLEMIYAPKVKGFDGCSGCTNLKTVFVPMATGITTDISSNATIYCSGRLTSIYFPNDFSAYKCTIVSPEYTAGLAIANSYGEEDRYIHISSDEIARDMGGQIRPRDNGLRFGFSFDENSIGFDFAKYADTVEYGFVYTYASFEGKDDFQINYSLRANSNKDNYIKKADKRTVDGTVSTYNAVFTGIPTEYINDKISARAYVNIDGMYFYSPVITRSYSSASNADDYVGIEEADNDIVFVHEHSFVKSVIAPKCEEKGYTLYKCAKCNESYTENYIDALGHNYKFVSADNSKLTYKCSDCDSTVIKTKSELPIFIDYVNTKVVRGNDNMYLDLNNDGYINAKDYALLNKIFY